VKFIEVEYNQDLKPLETVLSAVKRPGDFFVSVAVRQRSRLADRDAHPTG